MRTSKEMRRKDEYLEVSMFIPSIHLHSFYKQKIRRFSYPGVDGGRFDRLAPAISIFSALHSRPLSKLDDFLSPDVLKLGFNS